MISLPEQYVVAIFHRYVKRVTYNKYSRVYNGECPFCNEGTSHGRTKRFYFVLKTQTLYCHNCGYSHKPLKFITDITGKSISEVLKEVKDNGDVEVIKETPVEKIKTATLPEDSVNLSDDSQISFFEESMTIRKALQYIKDRKLDRGINSPKSFYISLKDKVHKNRLVIPFYDTDGKIIYYQSRTVLDKDNQFKPKYLSKTGDEKSLYGISNINESIPHIFILEGPIDSFFVENGVAVCGIQDESERMFTERQKQQLSLFPLHEHIWVLDNQYQDSASLKKSKILIDLDQKVFIWPEELRGYKDINEYVVSQGIDRFDTKKILDNTYQGLKGIFKLSEIKNR